VIDFGKVGSDWWDTAGPDGNRDESCVVTEYTPANTGRFFNGLPWRAAAYANVNCASSQFADTRTYYDGAAVTPTSAPSPGAPTYGNPTAVWRATGGIGVRDEATHAEQPAVVTRVAYGNNGFAGASASWGRVTSTTDARGNTTTVSYTPHGTRALGARFVTTTNALNQSATVEYDLWGNARRIHDANGRDSYTCYDALARVVKAYEPGVPGGASCTGSPSATVVYDVEMVAVNTTSVGISQAPRWSVQNRTLFALDADTFNPMATGDVYLEQWTMFDGMGRVAQTSQRRPAGAGRIGTRTRYDSQGRVFSQSDAFASGMAHGKSWWTYGAAGVPVDTRYTLDALGRPTTTSTVSWGNVVQYQQVTTYTATSSTETPATGSGSPTYAATVRWYDAYGHVWKITENADYGGNKDTVYRHDLAGNLTHITDSAGRVTTMSYNWLGLRYALDDNNAGASETRYAANGDILLTIDAANTSILRTYDQLNRVTRTYDGANTTLATYIYDTTTGGVGQLARADAYAGGVLQARTETIAYDAAGRPTTTRQTVYVADGPATGDEHLADPLTITVAYNRNGTIRETTYPGVTGSNLTSGETVTTVYNEFGLPIAVGAYTGLIEYDGLGRHVRTTMGPSGSQAGLIVESAYQTVDNRLSRLTARTRAGGSVRNLV